MAELRLQRLEDTIHDLADCIRREHVDRDKKKKKLPTFKFKGNEQQFEFNQDLLDSIDELRDLIEVGSVNRSSAVLEEMTTKLDRRQKMLKLADRSPGGWDTVREYLSDDLADDSADEKRIRNAENQAMKKRNAKKRKDAGATRYHPYRPPPSDGKDDQPRNVPRTSLGTTRDFLPPSRDTRSDRRTDREREKKCFRCNRFGHIRSECYAKSRAEDH